MSGRLIASLSLAALIGMSAAAPARSADMSPGQWTRETLHLGNKVTVDVFRRSPYSLTGNARAAQDRSTSREWTRETRHIGNKVTVDQFRR